MSAEHGTLPPLSPLIEARASTYLDDRALPPMQAMPLDIIQRAEEPTAVSDIDAVSEPVKVQRPYPESSYIASPQDEAHALLKNLLLSAVLVAFLVGMTCNTGRFTWVYHDRAWGRVHAAQQQRELLELCQLAATEALAQHRESTLIKGQEVA